MKCPKCGCMPLYYFENIWHCPNCGNVFQTGEKVNET